MVTTTAPYIACILHGLVLAIGFLAHPTVHKAIQEGLFSPEPVYASTAHVVFHGLPVSTMLCFASVWIVDAYTTSVAAAIACMSVPLVMGAVLAVWCWCVSSGRETANGAGRHVSLAADLGRTDAEFYSNRAVSVRDVELAIVEASGRYYTDTRTSPETSPYMDDVAAETSLHV